MSVETATGRGVKSLTSDEFISIMESMTDTVTQDLGWCAATTGSVDGEVVTVIDSPLGWLKV